MRLATLGLTLLLLASGCQGPAQASGNASPGAATSAKPFATLPLRLAFSHIHMAGVGDATAKTVVCRSEAELASALRERGLDTLPEGPETVAKALKAVDFTKETAILIDQGLVPSMTESVEPLDAVDTPAGITVRYAKRHSEIDLPALNRPYAILAIPKTDKAVTLELVGEPTAPARS
jgi:hypothetical protein